MKVDRATIATAVFVAVVFPFVMPKALACVVGLFLPMALLAKVLRKLEAKRQPRPRPALIRIGSGRYTLKEEIAFRKRGWDGVREERIKRISRYPGGPKAEVVSVIKTFHRISNGGDL